MTEHYVGDIDEFPIGEGTPVQVDGIPVAVFNVDGTLYAILDNCTHKNLPLSPIGDTKVGGDRLAASEAPVGGDESLRGGTSVRGDIDEDTLTISCPWHYMEWDLTTGETPLYDISLPTFDVRVADGEVFISI